MTTRKSRVVVDTTVMGEAGECVRHLSDAPETAVIGRLANDRAIGGGLPTQVRLRDNREVRRAYLGEA